MDITSSFYKDVSKFYMYVYIHIYVYMCEYVYRILFRITYIYVRMDKVRFNKPIFFSSVFVNDSLYSVNFPRTPHIVCVGYFKN